MIVAENSKPELNVFQSLMLNTDKFLNADALKRADYYEKRNGTLLETDVYDALVECSKKTPFEGSIQLVSGSAFPDIIASKCYGVEVKSTNKDKWTSIGSSILESTRIQDVERIYLTFGKLGKPIQFMSRPYEDCLSGISVTHYPRYEIDMRLKKGDTIFDKMGIAYDELRQLDNPVAPVSKYYKSKLKEGESLWWVGEDVENTTVPPTVKLWSSLSSTEKSECVLQGFCFFPELFSKSTTKYNQYSLWLATNMGVINNNIRDGFSAGGKVDIRLRNGIVARVPRAFGRIQEMRRGIITFLEKADESELKNYWRVPFISDDRLQQWCLMVYDACDGVVDGISVLDILESIFNRNIR